MTRLLAAVAALLLFNSAWACSCMARKDAGFIHANLKHLPANARGALFLTLDTQLKASAFVIASDAGALPASLSWPELDGKEQHYLARVAPAEGFKPGKHYKITYRGDSVGWGYPAQTDFAIDIAPLKLTDAPPQLILDGAPGRQLLQLETSAGSCSSQQPATVQSFHYDLPAAYLPYRSALYYATSSEGDHPETYFASLCGEPLFGATAFGEQHDMVHSSCDKPKGRFALRGWVGLLEVEDRPRPTNIVQVDLTAPRGLSCTPFGILKEVLSSRDSRRISNATCNISRAEWWSNTSGIPQDLPSESDILTLVHANNGAPRQCVLQALTTVLTHTPAPARTLGNALGSMFVDDLMSANKATVDTAITQLDEATRHIVLNGFQRQEYVQPHLDAVLTPLRPVLRKLQAGGKQLPPDLLNYLKE
ncbi:hypothetical protein GTP55_17905 [Duganella sp. FT109W]|uniref:Uncharacterized protein n=1 Tax=Duganella margarita TaxID=2692170 RepID=A0ABW9WK21_9BURK|nr:hypothetical protein [Duganella margarita]MYN41241.1 hypothetical protein [Duganella margarita]